MIHLAVWGFLLESAWLGCVATAVVIVAAAAAVVTTAAFFADGAVVLPVGGFGLFFFFGLLLGLLPGELVHCELNGGVDKHAVTLLKYFDHLQPAAPFRDALKEPEREGTGLGGSHNVPVLLYLLPIIFEPQMQLLWLDGSATFS
jgi:hypothetical protein